MTRYTDDSRERVRDAVDFVEIVGARTELRRAGAQRYQGRCPFHEERTPSFGIDPGRKVYHCFGCGAGGDLFRFVMETEGLDFTGALEALADRSGVALERVAEDPLEAGRRERRDRLGALLERTAEYYARVLWDSPEALGAREYLAERGLEEPVLRHFRVGWSPSGWDRVLTASRRAGFAEAELLAAGLAVRARSGEGGLYDRFRGRIMFPLADPRGRVLGFGARAMHDDQGPKYLNSAEVAPLDPGDAPLFRKGEHVYAHHLARADAARAGVVLLAEGYTDVIALHQAGVTNAVGLMGTALTPEQAGKLKQLAPTVALCLDADAAGWEAMARAAELLGGDRREVRVVPLPPGTDPAQLIAEQGPPAARALLERALPLARFEVDRALERGDLGTPEGRDRVVDDLRPVFAGLPEGLLRQDLLGRAADRLDTTPDLLAALLPGGGGRGRRPAPLAPFERRGAVGSRRRRPFERWAPGRGERPPAALPRSAPSGLEDVGGSARAAAQARWGRAEDTELAFLARCLAIPELGRRALEEAELERLFASELTRRAARYLLAHLHDPGDHLPVDDTELVELVAALILRADDLAPDADALALERLQLDKVRLDRDITAARRAGDPVSALAAERQRVHEEIRHRLV